MYKRGLNAVARYPPVCLWRSCILSKRILNYPYLHFFHRQVVTPFLVLVFRTKRYSSILNFDGDPPNGGVEFSWVINNYTTDLAVRCSTGSVELS